MFVDFVPGHYLRRRRPVAGKIARFLRGHSPIPEGPLHDLNLGRDLARTITPAPMLAAIRHVAMVTALAAPLMIGTGTSPAIAAGAASGRAPAVVINYTLQISGAAASDGKAMERVLEKHGRKLVDIMNRELDKRRRTEF